MDLKLLATELRAAANALNPMASIQQMYPQDYLGLMPAPSDEDILVSRIAIQILCSIAAALERVSATEGE